MADEPQIDAADKSVDEIDASPTKTFFVEMLIKDIPLEQAILDLVDDSIDSAKRFVTDTGRPFQNRWVQIEFDSTRFRIVKIAVALIGMWPGNTLLNSEGKKASIT